MPRSGLRRRFPTAATLLFVSFATACDDPAAPDLDTGPPVLEAISPATGVAGGEAVTLTLTGRRFTAESRVIWDQSSLTAAFVDDGHLRIVASEWLLRSADTIAVTVSTPGPEGGTSESVSFPIVHAVPQLDQLVTDTATAGRSDVTVRAIGAYFTPETVVEFDGAPVPTTYRSRTSVEFMLGAAQLTTPGTRQVTVHNPFPGGASGPLSFTVSELVPEITLLPVQGGIAGRSGFSLYVHGTGFMEGATVEWDGVEKPAQYLSDSRLRVAISSAEAAAPRAVPVRVRNPAGRTASDPATFTLRTLGAETSTVTRMPVAAVSDLVWDPGTARLYASVRSSGGTLGNTVAALDPETGTVADNVFVGSEPGRLARSDDGRYLYVGLNGASAVARVEIASLTPDIQWALPAGQVAGDLVVLPGAPGTVAVSRHHPGYSPPLEGVTVYDDGVARPESSPGHTGAARLEALDSPRTLYGFNNSHTGFEFFHLRVDEQGAHHVAERGGLISGFYTDIIGAGGRIYGTDGSVVDPELLTRLGSVPGSRQMAVDPRTGRVFVLRNGALEVYDLNTYQRLGSVPMPAGVATDPYSHYGMIRFGTDGLATFDQDEVVLIRSPLIAD